MSRVTQFGLLVDQLGRAKNEAMRALATAEDLGAMVRDIADLCARIESLQAKAFKKQGAALAKVSK